MFFGIITTPMYIYSILWLQTVIDLRRFKFSPDSTPSDYKTVGKFCLTKDLGNVQEWAIIEIITFYTNIVVMALNLFLTRVIGQGNKVVEVKQQEESLLP